MSGLIRPWQLPAKFEMKSAEVINRLLANFGVALVRRSTLSRLSNDAAKSMYLPATDDSLVELKEISRNNLISVENKIDELRKELLRQQISMKWDVVDYMERLVGESVKTEICPLCGYHGLAEEFSVLEAQCIFGGGRLKRHQCPKCDVIFGANKMLELTEAELTQDYESHYKIFQEGDSTEQEVRAFRLLNPTKNGVYLNYGAGGWSKSVQVLRGQGWNVFAFEPHDSAASNLDYLIKSKSDLLKMRYDGVFSNNVLEHLRYPVEELSFMKKILKEGGRMSHATPCFEYLYEYTRFHLYFYLGRSRSLLAEMANLVVSDFVVDNEFMCALYEIDNS